MISFLSAIALASFLGSLHCVGMCGPLAIWATEGGDRRLTLFGYHMGRLATYLSAGLFAGSVGAAISAGGDLAGFQSLASKVVGLLLVIVGLWRLSGLLPRRLGQPIRNNDRLSTSMGSKVTGLLKSAKPVLATRGPMGRAFLSGLLTTWLPCGWLYLFVLIASGTGGVIPAILTMIAFWTGTLPALTGVVLGAGGVLRRSPLMATGTASVLLILTGLYTATGRAAADLSTIRAPQLSSESSVVDSIQKSAEQPMPCCEPETDLEDGLTTLSR